jgi:YVTN family beta-propeller protein
METFPDHCEFMDISAGVRMNFWRGARLLGILTLGAISVSCGDQYRPVAIPIVPPPPNPAAIHFVLVLSDNGAIDPGASSRLDVSGDTNIGVAQLGLGPAHATLTTNAARVYAANTLEDSISSFSPTPTSTTTSVATTSLPTGSSPVFVHTTESATVYVANSGNGTVAAISATSNVVTNVIQVDPSQPVPDPNSKPVALAETPNGKKLYVVNQGTGSVTSINTIDGSVNGNSVIPTGALPVWAVARSDSARIYVLNSGSGTVSTIDTTADTVLSSVSVGVGANYMVYDSRLNRLYITNPAANTVTGLNIAVDPPALLFSVPVAASPVSVAALPDGSRIYVASISLAGGVATSQVTVVDASSGRVRTVIPLNSVPAGCSVARFQLFAAASADSTKVYVGNCDARSTSIIRTSDDQKVLDMAAPLSTITPPNGGNPLPQNPVFVLAGP